MDLKAYMKFQILEMFAALIQKKLRATPLNGYGYPQVSLFKNGKLYLMRVHRLVAIAFIPNPTNLPCINHKDENKTNNAVENLEWCDIKYNNNYGSHKQNVANSRSIAVEQYTLDGLFVKKWASATIASRTLKISQSSINSCCLHGPKYNHAGGFLWKYENDSTPLFYKHGKKVAKCSINGNIVEEYENITIACKKNNLPNTSISNCLHGRSKTAGGYIWKLI